MKNLFKGFDWWIAVSLLILALFSVSALLGFSDTAQSFAGKQVLWVSMSFVIMFIVSRIDVSFLNRSRTILYIYIFGVLLLFGLNFFGLTANGAQSWYSFGSFTFQPSDFMKLALALLLSKYLARRHVEIKSMKHVVITALYFLVPFLLVFLQPDFGSALILFAVWFGLMLVSGISKRHLLYLFVALFASFALMWGFVFKDYQKDRIQTFLDPLADVQGAGYNAFQSTIAVGSGGFLGKGVGFGTQSRLSFLPENETDFIFASISEEWGFVGSLIVLGILLFIVLRILYLSLQMSLNFELLFGVAIAFYFLAHIVINVGMNIGIMPVTGVPLPFVSYGGSHLMIEYVSLGIFMAMIKSNRSRYKEKKTEIFL